MYVVDLSISYTVLFCALSSPRAGGGGNGKRGKKKGKGGRSGGGGGGDGDDSDSDGHVGFADGSEEAAADGVGAAAASPLALRKRLAGKLKGAMALSGGAKRRGGAVGGGASTGTGDKASVEDEEALELEREKDRMRRKKLGVLMNWDSLSKLEVRWCSRWCGRGNRGKRGWPRGERHAGNDDVGLACDVVDAGWCFYHHALPIIGSQHLWFGSWW